MTIEGDYGTPSYLTGAATFQVYSNRIPAELPAGMTGVAMMPIVGQRGLPFSEHALVRLFWRQAVFATGVLNSFAFEAWARTNYVPG